MAGIAQPGGQGLPAGRVVFSHAVFDGYDGVVADQARQPASVWNSLAAGSSASAMSVPARRPACSMDAMMKSSASGAVRRTGANPPSSPTLTL
ncbi:hypothetical protein G6F40_017495 [Rhizopus arrhizus]|nr:hypothetical protein G6F40_017495 [Rhizopus arrhizus]